MTCVNLADGGVLCISGGDFAMRKVIYCPTCERRRRFVVVWGGVWYADVLTCVACGDSWCEGVRQERPFARGWRQQSIARARKHWDTAVSAEEFKRRTLAELQRSIGGV